MKNAKLFGFFAGTLSVLAAGCFNPAAPAETAGDPPAEASLGGDPRGQPFSVDILIGGEARASARSVVGPDTLRIQGDILNISQLVVADDEGNIAAFIEKRLKNPGDSGAEFFIPSIAYDTRYHFLLLMGHWDREDYPAGSGGNYKYKDGPNYRSPTLLAAGLTTEKVSESGKVTVIMWPILVDTAFTAPSLGDRSVGPVLRAGEPEAAALLPVEWNVKWTIRRGASGDGLADLAKAQEAAGGGEGLEFKGRKTWLNGKAGAAAVYNGNTITKSIGGATKGLGKIGTEGNVQFNLEYIPFNLPAAKWIDLAEDPGISKFNLSEGGPVWIIRNGLNDEEQDGDTDFISYRRLNPAKTGDFDTSVNGNGAAKFTVKAKVNASLIIKNGNYAGGTPPTIGFTTAGYADPEEAEAYYAVTNSETPPAYSDSGYTKFPTGFKAGEYKGLEIDRSGAGDGYDVYVFLVKDGELSTRYKISSTGGGYTLYVASDGADGPDRGSGQEPLATLGYALGLVKATYKADVMWPDDGTVPCTIIIQGGIETGSGAIIADPNGEDYPPIILRGGEMASGALKLTGNGSLITVGAGAKVTLGSTGKVLALEGKSGNTAALVTVDGGELTLENGAVITGNKSSTDGGGVYVASGTFTMTGGEISGNESAGLGGGVYISGSGNFSKTGGGLIYGNDGSASANTAAQGDTWGHAVDFAASPGYYRDTTLDIDDDISAGNLPVTPKQTYDETNWIKRGSTAMLPVAGGTFQMGNPNPPSNMQFEGLVHEVTVSSFSMGKYEVTQKEWTLVMGTTVAQQLDLYNQDVDLYNQEVALWNAIEANTPKKSTRSYGVLYGEGDNYPMYYISWFEMVEYCNRLSEAEGIAPAYTIGKGTDPWTVTCNFTAPGYRLPTEAEWEYAARGGNTGQNFTYSGSNNADEVAWYYENSGASANNGKAHPVGEKKPNALGLYDMSGNVFERCWDRVGENISLYPSESQLNPTGPSSGDNRIGRGGYWGYSADYARSTRRVQGSASSRSNGTGFRVVRLQP